MMQDLQDTIILGICAMDTKARCKAMEAMLTQLITHGQIEIIIFSEETILTEPIENWPLCNCLIAFYSDGFPLEKAIAYAELRQPYCINELSPQKLLLDRRIIMDKLDSHGVSTPRHLFLNRDVFPYSKWEQETDWIEVDGVRMEKPFVEKPVFAEDHNNYIYYSSEQKGGCRKLFRKVNDESSRFYPDINRVRDKGSYLYEEFIETDNFMDIKVYAVGKYFYAEQRKSPAADGKVERTTQGREVRTSTALTEEETDMVKKIVSIFKQRVCGIDILRAGGRSYICDVNGWSFVKGQDHFYQRASRELYRLMLERSALEEVVPVAAMKERK